MNPTQANDPKRGPLIIHHPHTSGFFYYFGVIFKAIDAADQNGWIPVIDMERHGTHYTEAQPIHGTRNVWEYYFEQPGGISLAEAIAQGAPENTGDIGRELGSVKTPASPERTDYLLKKYIRVRPEILSSVDSLVPNGPNPKVCGIHVRGTDMRQGLWWSHHIPDVPLAYLEKAKALDKEHAFSSLFLACDETEVVDLFREAFGERLKVAEAHRVSGNQSFAIDKKWLHEDPRPLHRYLLGREVLVDMLALARCGHLICGNSNVAVWARKFAPKSQIAHELPALWVVPDHNGVSQGKSKTTPDGTLDTPLGNARVAFFRSYLEQTENELFAVKSELAQLKNTKRLRSIVSRPLKKIRDIYRRIRA